MSEVPLYEWTRLRIHLTRDCSKRLEGCGDAPPVAVAAGLDWGFRRIPRLSLPLLPMSGGRTGSSRTTAQAACLVHAPSRACLDTPTRWPPALRAGPNRLFQALELYWRSLESSDVQYQLKQLKKTI